MAQAPRYSDATVMRASLLPYYLMGALIVVSLVITAGAGVFVEGIYRPFLSETLVAFQFFQDMLSLVFAPVLLAAMYFSGRGSARALVVWAGLLVYVLYYYSFYGLDKVYTQVYPFYLALMGLSTYSLIGLLTGIDLAAFRDRVREGMPVRFIAVVLGMPLIFVFIWMSMLLRAIAAQQAGETDTVFVLDLCFLIPATTFTAVQIWRCRPLGYLLGGVLLIKAAVSGILLTGGEILKMQRGLPPSMDQLSMYVFLAVLGSVGLALYMRNLEDRPTRRVRTNTQRPLGEHGS